MSPSASFARPPRPPSEPSSPTADQINHQQQHHQRHHPPPSEPGPSSHGGFEARRSTLPFSFRRPFRPNISSTSLVPSTAEGRPIPVDGSTAENRTSALRELNNNYPSRHRYAKSTGAQSSTYSEPVIVRSYYSPSTSRPISASRGGVVVHQSDPTVSDENQVLPRVAGRMFPYVTPASSSSSKRGLLSSMARSRGKKLGAGGSQEEAKLPPIEAFTFRSFMANMDAQNGGHDINSDLDRIAEICAKSRYSLSNQYEVHYAPHGSGSSFLATTSRNNENHGPTLQIVSSDDERNMRQQRRRRGGVRRNSRAMGTLETIMSSSRSSDEDKSKKKSAAEIAEEVRGRAGRKVSGESTPSSTSRSASDGTRSQDEPLGPEAAAESRAMSLALLDGPRQSTATEELTPGRVGQPALPQASTSQLEIRTAPERSSTTDIPAEESAKTSHSHTELHSTGTRETVEEGRTPPSHGSLLSALTAWMPWGFPDENNKPSGRAEGSLRELLKSNESKGKDAAA